MAFCAECGRVLEAGDRFCGACGTQVRTSGAISENRPSDRSRPMFQASTESASNSAVASSSGDSRTRRPLLVAAVLLTIIFAGWLGYSWFRPSTRNSRAAAVIDTEQALESPQSTVNPSVSTRGNPSNAIPPSSKIRNIWLTVAEFTSQTTDAENAVGPPDGRVAGIQPGGSLALQRIDGPLFNGDGPDVRVDGPAGHRVPYAIFAADGHGGWTRFDANRKGFPTGSASHDFGHHGMQQALQIMIRNEGATPLYIDAITPLHLQPEIHEHDEPTTH